MLLITEHKTLNQSSQPEAESASRGRLSEDTVRRSIPGALVLGQLDALALRIEMFDCTPMCTSSLLLPDPGAFNRGDPQYLLPDPGSPT